MYLFEPENLATAITDYQFDIHRRNVNGKDVYTIPYKLGTNPGVVVDLVLATNSEWTYVTGRNCTQDNGCSRGVYNHYTTNSENVNWTIIHQNIPQAYNFTGYRAEDVLRYRNGVNIIDMKYPFFMIEAAQDLISPQNQFPHDGILGLSPDVDGDDYLTLGVPMPVHMKKKRRINKAIVAIDMKKFDNQTSTFELGKYSTGKFRFKTEKDSELGWISVKTNTTSFSWRTEMKNIFYNRSSFNDTKFEDKSIDDGFQNMAVFDSFYGGIHMPVSEWKPLFQMETNSLSAKGIDLICNYKSYSCYYEGQCKPELFSSFGFNFVGDRAYILKP